MIKTLLREFVCMVESGKVEIYNEFSLQHELGIFLREKLPNLKVQFERNTRFFGISNTIKHEIDIVVYNDLEKYAIELKYPVNGQYPEQMYSFVKDIAFMEQLKNNGFKSTYCVTMVKDKNFYSGKKVDGIYAYFRANKTICGEIKKPTGTKQEAIFLNNKYNINWAGDSGEFNYYIVDVNETIANDAKNKEIE